MSKVETQSSSKKWLDWNSASVRTRERYLHCSADAVAAVLNCLSPENAAQIWRSLQSSKLVDLKLGIGPTVSSSERSFLQALSETYSNASSWDTRRQILSIMADKASYQTISEFIPGLTKYRYSVANLHRLQYGRGVPVPKAKTSRVRIERDKLDHFLTFITSPHIIQDLPFGEKTLRLSSGSSISIPNVVRTMIPRRICEQYSAFCNETYFETFSQRTMLRILSACSSSVRKSLQGLDNYAAEGAKAFDELIVVAEKCAVVGAGLDWQKEICDALKVAKMYLKGDYKVSKTKVLNFKVFDQQSTIVKTATNILF